MGGELESENKD